MKLIALFILVFSICTNAQLDYDTGEINYDYNDGDCFKNLRSDFFFHITQKKPDGNYGYKVEYKKNLFTDEPLLNGNNKIWITSTWMTITDKEIYMNYKKTECIDLF